MIRRRIFRATLTRRVLFLRLAALLPVALLLFLAYGGGSRAYAQAPPPPPAEGLDPATAPATSTAPAEENGSEAKLTTHAAHQLETPGRVAPTPATSPDTQETGASLPDASFGASPLTVFRLDFMQRALSAGLIVSGVCAFLGVYVVLRRIVFVGVALAEMSSAGVALSLLVGLSPMLGSIAVMLAGVWLLSVRWGGRRIRQDAFIGVGYVVASAFAILLIAKSPKGEGSLLDVLFGNILTVTASDVTATAVALALVLLFHAVFYKELLFVSFDPDTATASGFNSRLWEALLYVTIGLSIACAIHAVGVLLAFAALVIPAVTALLLTRRMAGAFTVSIIAGLLPVPIGLYLSFVADLPSAATIVATSFGLLVVAGIVSRLRGSSA